MFKSDTERNAVLYKQLNEIDDRRERLIKASSTGRHEPSSMYDGLYDVEEIDDGGRLIARRERGIEPAFVPVSELPNAAKFRLIAPTGKKPDETTNTVPTRSSAPRPAVLRRRGTTLHAI